MYTNPQYFSDPNCMYPYREEKLFIPMILKLFYYDILTGYQKVQQMILEATCVPTVKLC